MAWVIALLLCSCVASRPLDTAVWSAPPGEVVGLYLYFTFRFWSSPLVFGGAGTAGMSLPLEGGYFRLDIFISPCRFLIVVCSDALSTILVERRLVYSTTSLNSFKFIVIRLVTSEQSSDVAYDTLESTC